MQYTVNIYFLIFVAIYRNVKVISFAILIACLFVVNSDAATNCQQRGIDLSNCLSSSAAGDVQTYCNNCANSLIRYFQDCARGVGVDAVKQGIFSLYI